MNEQQARQLLASPDLTGWLRVRLVLIAAGDNPSAAIRAIEMLLGIPQDAGEFDLSEVSTEALILARNRARGFIESVSYDYTKPAGDATND